MRGGTDAADGLAGAGRRGARAPRGAGRQAARRRRRTRCSSRCAPARASRCPGMMDTVLNLGLNDESRRRARRALGRRALRVGLLPALHADVRQRRRAAFPASASRTRSRASRTARGVTLDTELDADALRELTETFQRLLRLPDRPARAACAARSAPCSTPGRASARSPTAGSTASPTTGARRSTSSRWFRQPRRDRGSGVAFIRDEVTGAPEPSG